MVIFYRGKHCPICKAYLETLQEKVTQITEQGINLLALSSDTRAKAELTYRVENS
jgi:peroxiredoxin